MTESPTSASERGGRSRKPCGHWISLAAKAGPRPGCALMAVKERPRSGRGVLFPIVQLYCRSPISLAILYKRGPAISCIRAGGTFLLDNCQRLLIYTTPVCEIILGLT